MGKLKYYSEEGLNVLKEELNQLMYVERQKISQQIAEARDKGDLDKVLNNLVKQTPMQVLEKYRLNF